MAKLLFEDYCIKCEDKAFRFAEIEFYYYRKEESSQFNLDGPWNKETYPRNKNAGKLFFHYSGADICFQCHFDEKEKNNDFAIYGGILIRSLRDGNNILAGPLFCANAMLNSCDEKMPELARADHQQCVFKTTTRYGISSDETQEGGKKLYLCYYLTHVENEELDWQKTSERIAWDKKGERFKKSSRNYMAERFV